MELSHVTFVGPKIDDEEILGRCPPSLAGLLRQMNGFVQFHGGLHVRGACHEPAWHSLRNAWIGDVAFHKLYPDVQATDVPFGEDCMGDQFLLREDVVWKMSAETGELETLDQSLREWFEAVQADPVEVLSLQPLLQFREDGGNLEVDQLLAAWPPYCMESDDGVSLTAISADERRRFLADMAKQIRDVPDGGEINFKLTE